MTLQGDALKDAIGRTRDKWGWFVGLGVLLLIFGGIAFGTGKMAIEIVEGAVLGEDDDHRFYLGDAIRRIAGLRCECGSRIGSEQGES